MKARSLKIESGPVERQPLEERPNQPGAKGALPRFACIGSKGGGVGTTVPQG